MAKAQNTDSAAPATASPATVSLGVSTFVDDHGDLSELHLEEVVEMFKTTEKSRGFRTEPDNEAEVPRRVKLAPVELMSSLNIVAAHLNVSRSVLTKCMSHHVIDWYTNALGMDMLAAEYHDVYAEIKQNSYTTLRIQAENPPRFSLAHQPEQVSTSLSTIRWVLVKLAEVGEITGIDSTSLLLVGFCWSLTTLVSSEWDAANIRRHFLPESRNMKLLVADRMIDVKSLKEKMELRRKI